MLAHPKQITIRETTVGEPIAIGEESQREQLLPHHETDSPFRFLDLPTEIRYVVYEHYYDTCDLLLKDAHAHRERDPCNEHCWVTMSNMEGTKVDKSLHQVCQQIALEATPIWHSKSSQLTLQCDPPCLAECDEFLPPDVCGTLPSRLTTLVVMNPHKINKIDWSKCLKQCRQLQNVDFIIKKDSTHYVNTWHFGGVNGLIEANIRDSMSGTNDTIRSWRCWAEEEELKNLAFMLQQRCEEEYSVKAIFWLTEHYTFAICIPRLCRDAECAARPRERSMLTGTNEELVGYGPFTNHLSEQMARLTDPQYFEFKITPEEIELSHVVYQSEHSVRALWWYDMEKPEVTKDYSNKWQLMKISTDINGEKYWVVPWVSKSWDVKDEVAQKRQPDLRAVGNTSAGDPISM